MHVSNRYANNYLMLIARLINFKRTSERDFVCEWISTAYGPDGLMEADFLNNSVAIRKETFKAENFKAFHPTALPC